MRLRTMVMGLVTGLAALLVAGCGGTTTVNEGPVTVAGGGATSTTGADVPRPPSGARAVRIFVVTHGQASSPLWAIVRNGAEAGGRQMDAVVTYRAPDVYSLDHMVALIDQAIAAKPDGLVVSLPEPGLAPAIRRAVKAGIPTVTINSGSDVYAKLGVLAHVGQPEAPAGFKAGQRLARAGVRRALCVNLQIPRIGAGDARGWRPVAGGADRRSVAGGGRRDREGRAEREG